VLGRSRKKANAAMHIETALENATELDIPLERHLHGEREKERDDELALNFREVPHKTVSLPDLPFQRRFADQDQRFDDHDARLAALSAKLDSLGSATADEPAAATMDPPVTMNNTSMPDLTLETLPPLPPTATSRRLNSGSPTTDVYEVANAACCATSTSPRNRAALSWYAGSCLLESVPLKGGSTK
jgi:hypothetical protein